MKFRHENKYLISNSDVRAIVSRLSQIATFDPHTDQNGFYKIRSLYFDNDSDKALIEKATSLPTREKFRIRYYNDDDSFIQLEKKSKIRGLCHKQKTCITRPQCEAIIRGEIGFLIESENPLFHELYAKMKYERLRPKVLVDYKRQVFLYRPGNVRVTFDTDIRSGLAMLDMFNISAPTWRTHPTGNLLMEVKWDEYLPDIIKDMIHVSGGRPWRSASKYELCRGVI